MRFTDFTLDELRDLAPAVAAIHIPLGCTEQQGPHLPTDFDAWMITKLCEAISEALRERHGVTTLVMPTMPFGPTPEHAGFGHGYVNLRQSTHEAVVQDVLGSLAEQGYRKLLVWRGCGQHRLDRVIDRFNRATRDAAAFQPVIGYPVICEDVFAARIPGGHADSFATSIRLHLDPGAVRKDRIKKPHNEPFDWDGELDFHAVSDTGVIGDPTHATAEIGAELWRRCVDEGVEIVLELIAGRVDGVRQDWHFPSDPPAP